jgi:chaperonin GroEL
VVIGGGVALLNAIPALDGMKAGEADEATALRCLKRALEAPLRQLAANAGEDGGAVVGQVRWLQQELKNPRIGYDVLRQEYGDLMEWGVMDPMPVVRAAMRNAVSAAWIILSIEASVGIIPGQKVRFTEPGEQRRQRAARRADLRERARREGGRLRPPRRVWSKP